MGKSQCQGFGQRKSHHSTPLEANNILEETDQAIITIKPSK